MTFGATLQGQSSHDALIHRQDTEIKLLENFKKCLHSRIKADRDYAAALTSIVATAQKFDCSEYDSPLFKCWTNMLTHTSAIAGHINENTSVLCTDILEKLIQLITELKTNKKTYVDTKQSLELEFNKLKDIASRLKVDYEKQMKVVKSDRVSYEEVVSKGKAVNKVEESRARYQRSTTKLHRIHNKYVIAVNDISLYQNSYLANILPSLLTYQQWSQEYAIRQYKDVLRSYQRLTDTSSEVFINSHSEIQKSVQQILPTKEYNTFVEKHKSDKLESQPFDFQEDLLCNYDGELRVNIIQLDTMTLEALQQMRSTYDEKLLRATQMRESKSEEIKDVEEKLKQMPPDKERTPEEKVMVRGFERSLNLLSHELTDHRCNESRYKTLSHLISSPLDKLGEDEPHCGLDLPEAVVVPPALPASPAPSMNLGAACEPENSAQNESVDGELNISGKETLGRKFAKSFEHFKSNFTRKNSETSPNKPPSRSTLEDSSNTNQYKIDNSVKQPCLRLEDEEWFHGILPRKEVERLLEQKGDYLMRVSQKKDGTENYVLSVGWEVNCEMDYKHFIIQGEEGSWHLEGNNFSTIGELIRSQHASGQPVTKKSQVLLFHAVVRESWELHNDHIETMEKIGNGNFGDVFRGLYKDEVVAVKTCKEHIPAELKKVFLREGAILRKYNHPNIVRLIGIATQKHPVMIVMEYVQGGALLKYLKDHGSKCSQRDLIHMCKDAANGMEYLAEQNCIHRDLAARNCLIDKGKSVKIADFGMSREEELYLVSAGPKQIPIKWTAPEALNYNSDHAVKIADFGMSKDEEVYVVSKGLKQIPIKWTAPEALNFGKYTSACDVWSFGVLMWEVFSLGESPYPGMTNAQARETVDKGNRMAAPMLMPTSVEMIMKNCWLYEPENRPSFKRIHTDLKLSHRLQYQ